MIVNELKAFTPYVFHIRKPDNLNLDTTYITYNFTSYPMNFYNDKYHSELINVTINVVCADLQALLSFVEQIEKVTDYHRIASFYEENLKKYIFILEKEMVMDAV